jgi:hypothetical protein
MQSLAHRAPSCLIRRPAAGIVLLAILAGCTGQSSQQAIDKQIADNPQFKKANVVKFSGRVAVDAQPPAKGFKLFVILNDPQHLDEAAHATMPKLYATCDDNGGFAFSTNGKEDGVPAGKYVVTFVELKLPNPSEGTHFHGPKLRGGARLPHYEPPDELKNLYNDPDKNAKNDLFNLNLEPPGKDDYQFDLAVLSKDPVATPGANAVTSIGLPRR